MTASLDVTDPTAATRVVSDAVDHFGRIDVLVNNAGYGLITAFEEMSPEQIHQQFATNVYGVMNVTRAVLPVMRRQRSGHLFTIASMGGYLGGSRGTAYAASKFAVAGFTESLALELEEFGITATIVGPGYFRTDFLDKSSAILEPATLCITESLVPIHAPASDSAANPKKRRRSCRALREHTSLPCA